MSIVNKILKESVHHATYHCFSIDKNYQVVNQTTVSNDLAADSYMYPTSKDVLFAFCSTENRTSMFAKEAIELLKQGKTASEIWDIFN